MHEVPGHVVRKGPAVILKPKGPANLCTVLNRIFYNFFLGFSGRCTFFRPRFCEISEKSSKFKYFEQFPSIPWNSEKKKIHEICTEKCRIKWYIVQNLQNFTECWRNFENWCEGLQNSSDLAGESCTVWKTLQNAPTLAIVTVQTAETEPPKVLETPEKWSDLKQCRTV